MSEQKRYVVGFMFDYNRDVVVLIKKNRPEWQAGLLNGVGGKIEPGEYAENAMAREFMEETGVQTKETDWDLFCIMQSENAKIYCYRCYSGIHTFATKTITDEHIGIYDWRLLNNTPSHYMDSHSLRLKTVPNLMWLVPMAAYDRKIYSEVQFAKFQ
jgi:8-oxo-dGTP diphosphatase